MRIFVALTWSSLFAVAAYASEIPSVWDHPASMSMGGAYTSVANDDAAFWTNPSGIARTKKARSKQRVPLYRAPNITYGANNKNVAAGVSKLGSESKRLDILSNALKDTDGKQPVWFAAGVEFLGVISKNASSPIGLGVYNHTASQLQIDSEDLTGAIDENTNVRSTILSDTGALLNFTFADKSNRASFGIQARYIASRFSLNAKTPLKDFTTKSGIEDEIKPKGSKSKGVALDLGALYSYPDFWFPTIGLAIFNLPTGCTEDYLNPYNESRETVCGTVFKGDLVTDDPRALDPTDIRVGFSMTPRVTKAVSMRLALDVHNLYIPYGGKNYGLADIPIDRQLHAGVEFFVGNPLVPSALRLKLGMNQTSFTVGGTMMIGDSLILDFARYGKDVSSGPTPKSDTRYLINMGLMF